MWYYIFMEDTTTQLAKYFSSIWPHLRDNQRRLMAAAEAVRKWKKINTPTKVNGHDFPDTSVPKALLYGIYDIGLNSGYINIGINHDTGEFAVASIKGWWLNEGRIKYPTDKKIFLTADGGGSNGYGLGLWMYELHKFADEFDQNIEFCHFPPGTSKWNENEHRLLSQVWWIKTTSFSISS
jgi:hypothetical protein